jgi:hypothetical protein
MLINKESLVDVLLQNRNKTMSESIIMEEVYAVLDQNEAQRTQIKEALFSESSTNANYFNFDLLETHQIFHIDQIKTICIDYRLRFLESNLFQNPLPEEAITKIDELQKLHKTELNGFKIVAPSSAFNLKNYDDPLLFAPIGNGYYYLIHKWGNDVSFLRKWKFKPIKNIENFLIFSVLLSWIVALITPETNLSRQIPMASLIVFLFAFKSIVGVALYYFFMMGKNFNTEIWNREFKEN